MTTRRLSLCLFACLAAAVAWTLPADAQSWPVRPVKIIVPYPPGGNTDVNARVIGAALGQALGQQFIIDNRPGANGAIAAELAARAAPDGYTLFMAALPQIAIFPAMTKTSYDPVKDFTPISEVATNPFVIVTSTKLMPAKSLPEFVAYVKANQGKLAYASAGIGSLSQLSMILFLKRAGLEMTHVAYKGGAPAITDVVAGQVPVYFANISEAVPHAKDPAVRLLAVSSAKRTAAEPDLPTVAESGYPGFETVTWNGLLGPAHLPQPIVDKLSAEVARQVKDPEVIKRFAALGVDPLGNTPAEFAKQIKIDIAQWAEAVKASGAKVE